MTNKKEAAKQRAKEVAERKRIQELEAKNTFKVKIPDGAVPGNTFSVEAPSGEIIHLTVPEGMIWYTNNKMTNVCVCVCANDNNGDSEISVCAFLAR